MIDIATSFSSSSSLSILTAASLGAIHALEPGHGKVVIVTYMGQSSSRWMDVLKLGGVITLAHSLVLLVGILLVFGVLKTMSFSAVWLDVLQLISAVLVVLLGVNMLRRLKLNNPKVSLTCASSCQHKEDSRAERSILNATSQWEQNKELFLLGVMSGLRPCPLTLSSLSLAISMGQLQAFMFILFFTVGMSGMLMLFGLAGKLGAKGLELGSQHWGGLERFQQLFMVASGFVVLIMGLVFVGHSFLKLI
jgi:nickel/cobalt exporter